MDKVLSDAVSHGGIPPCGECDLCLLAIEKRDYAWAVGCHQRYADEYRHRVPRTEALRKYWANTSIRVTWQTPTSFHQGIAWYDSSEGKKGNISFTLNTADPEGSIEITVE